MSCSHESLNRLWGSSGLKNFLLDGSHDDKDIWRQTSLTHFLTMLREKRNSLSHVSKWKDPFEGVVFKAKYVDEKEQEVPVERLYAGFFGQCWTEVDADNELMWHARSADGYGVCLKTKLHKLKAALVGYGYENVEQCPAVVIGKIQYKRMSTIKNLINEMGREHKKDAKLGRLSENGAISLFYLKRDIFSNEKEVRLMVNVGSSCERKKGVFEIHHDDLGFPNIISYQIEAQNFIDEVILDPRMPSEITAYVEEEAQNKGWRFKVRKSSLYEYIVPRPTIRVYQN